ncbi:hypothetical protein [Pedobacter sp.]
MKVSILERLQIQSIVPKEGDVVSLIHIKDILSKVEITAKEAEECELKHHDNGMVTFNPEKAIVIDVKLNVEQIIIIKAVLNKKNEEKSLRLELLDLYQKFEKL